jgi:hypothetical protein
MNQRSYLTVPRVGGGRQISSLTLNKAVNGTHTSSPNAFNNLYKLSEINTSPPNQPSLKLVQHLTALNLSVQFSTKMKSKNPINNHTLITDKILHQAFETPSGLIQPNRQSFIVMEV